LGNRQPNEVAIPIVAWGILDRESKPLPSTPGQPATVRGESDHDPAPWSLRRSGVPIQKSCVRDGEPFASPASGADNVMPMRIAEEAQQRRRREPPPDCVHDF